MQDITPILWVGVCFPHVGLHWLFELLVCSAQDQVSKRPIEHASTRLSPAVVTDREVRTRGLAAIENFFVLARLSLSHLPGLTRSNVLLPLAVNLATDADTLGNNPVPYIESAQTP